MKKKRDDGQGLGIRDDGQGFGIMMMVVMKK